MVEYFIGTDQMFDPGWLSELSQTFIAERNSSLGFTKVLRKILDSNIFQESNPVASQCYDLTQDSQREGRPPCEVAYLLEKNCSQCHNSQGAARGLDLTSWVVKADGRYGFAHQSREGEITPTETLQRIEERINSSDPDFRMPLGKHMSSQDRQALYLWVKSQPSEN